LLVHERWATIRRVELEVWNETRHCESHGEVRHVAWTILFLAGLFEVGWAVGLKMSDGLSRFWPSVATVILMAISLTLLGISLKSLPLGTAYAIWTGVGALGTVLLGIAFFGESASLPRLACVALIIAGIVGLKLVTPEAPNVPQIPPAIDAG
jgi:quaternary ammonium compound-resistance protein SugE